LEKDFCHCAPHLNVQPAVRPYGDRMVFVGDCGTTRLFKDGIGAAYRTARAAARTAIFRGIGEADFRRAYRPLCRSIEADNRLGRIVFGCTRQLQRSRPARVGLWRMTSREQKLEGAKRRMSRTLWDTFTGSAPYKSVFLRSLHPAFLGRLAWELAAGLASSGTQGWSERVAMASGTTGLSSDRYPAGRVVYREGDPGDCMYVLQDGRAERVRNQNGREVRVAVLEKGAFFGEQALFRGTPRSSTLRVLEDAGIVVLRRFELLQRLHEDPSMAFRLIEKMASRIRGLERSLIRSAQLPAEPWELPDAGPTDRAADPPHVDDDTRTPGRKYAAGDVVYRQGDRGDCMYVIRSGAVEVREREGEREHVLPVLGRGDFFGETALFGDELRTVTVRAREDSRIVTLERNGLLTQIHDEPSAAFSLMENMAERIARLELARLRFATPAEAGRE